ncbi:SRPBCC domain-containing protein [Actinomycetospora termitidis]|uniref:SRPBCC domain-containing protein n=1 Tax=Actinomycetospora termitidis TaxID=3053470 RepID=A0ABT7MA23_9PSEU|nr:SRPBCC domain-containing protein [Actinomycetospora sp. Odt1-22]MDL5157501.1 SRPBCC domain-containing protein [Actinomycetospora sp. Odt1-22]
MQLENTFTVPVAIDTVYDAMNDPEKITPCFPGATLTSADGDDFTGTVKVKLGPISMTYKGKGTFVERDKSAHKIVVDAQGRDSRGNGTASAKATLTMSSEGPESTKVTVLTEMQVTGKPAQFGRGVMSDVGDKILGQFASCLADEFADAPAPEAAPASAQSNGSAAPVSSGTEPVSGAATPVSQPASPAPVAAGSGAPEAAPMASTVAEARKADEAAAVPGGSPASGAGPRPVQSAPKPKRQQAEAIDLLDASSDALTKRLVPVAAGVGVLALILLIIRLARR